MTPTSELLLIDGTRVIVLGSSAEHLEIMQVHTDAYMIGFPLPVELQERPRTVHIRNGAILAIGEGLR